MKDIALSILGNCCMDVKCRKEVLWKEGIPIICEVLTTCEVESIQNRACRTLGNLSIDPECCAAVHQQEELLPTMVELFEKASENDTKLTFARTLRLLGDTPQHQKVVVTSEGIKPLGEMLKSEDSAMITAGLKGITELTKTMSSHIARQLVSAEAPASLIALTTHSSSTISNAAESLIMNYTKSEDLRPGIGAAGGIQFFIDGISNTELPSNKRLSMANALCLCCHDSVNRFRIRNHQGLDVLMDTLNDNKFNFIHNRIISSLVCFMYDDSSLQVLLELDLIKQLIVHLRRVARLGPEVVESEHFLQNRKVHETSVKCLSRVHSANNPDRPPAEPTLKPADVVLDHEEEHTKGISYTTTGGVTCDRFEHSKGVEGSGDVLQPETISQSVKMPLVVNVDSEENVYESLVGEDVDSSHSTGLGNNDDTDSKTGGLKESQSEPILSHSSKKYSIDSPTYKEVAEWKFEDHYSGPTNIHDSMQYSANSPEMVVPCWSPPHTSPYSPLSTGFSDWSPDHSPIHSPTRSESLRSFSPACSPNSSPSYMPESPSMYGPLSSVHSPQSPQWSPTLVHNSRVHSPSPDGLPLRDHGLNWNTPTLNAAALQYSSDEDSSDVFDIKESSKSERSALKPIAIDTTAAPSTSDSSSSMPTSEISDTPLDSLPAFAEVSSVESKAVETKRRIANRRESIKKKKKPTESPLNREKILKAVETSSSSVVDLSKMISKMPETPESASDRKKETHLFAKDPRKVTEHYLLVILSRISYLDNPKKHLVDMPVWHSLLDYLRKASRPLPRAERILTRLCKNPLCFEAIVELMIPFHIAYGLSEFVDCDEIRDQEISDQTVAENPPAAKGDTSSTSREVSFTVGGESLESDINKRTEGDDAKERKTLINTDAIKLQRELMLNSLALVSESQFGQGVLAHILMKKGHHLRQRCAVSLAYICRSRDQRKKMYLSLDGLKWLFDAADSDDIVIQTKAMMSLLQLSKDLLKASHRKDTKESKNGVETLAEVLTYQELQAYDVSFKLQSGESVTGHRGTIALGSEVFAAMLQGHYSESCSSEIEISDASQPAFQILINYLHAFGALIEKSKSIEDDFGAPKAKRKKIDSESEIKIKNEEDNLSSELPKDGATTSKDACAKTLTVSETSLDTLIELIGLADRYMLESLQSLVCDHITTHYLTPENVIETCRFALLYNCGKLAENCLGFIIFGDLPLWRRLAVLSQVLKSENAAALNLLKDLITKQIKH